MCYCNHFDTPQKKKKKNKTLLSANFTYMKRNLIFCQTCGDDLPCVLPPESCYTVSWATKYQKLGIIALLREVSLAQDGFFPEKVPLIIIRAKKKIILHCL